MGCQQGISVVLCIQRTFMIKYMHCFVLRQGADWGQCLIKWNGVLIVYIHWPEYH